jgi:antitoxin component YwqK of YwqJK toxin-antitoxin module
MRLQIFILFTLCLATSYSQTISTTVSDTSVIITFITPENNIIFMPDTDYYIRKDLVNGQYKIYHDKDKKYLAILATYNSGKLVDPQKQWYKNGQLKKTEYMKQNLYSKDTSTWKRESTEWYWSGKLKETRKCPSDTCITEGFYENGQLRMKDISVNEHWIYSVRYCDNGQLIATPSNPSSHDKVFSIIYYCSGIKKMEYCTIGGALIGNYKEFNELGQLVVDGQYDDDPQKIHTHMHIHGVDFDKIGTWKYYDNKGKLVKEEAYNKGKIMKTKTY